MVFRENPCGDVWPPFTLSCVSAVITIIVSMVTIPGNFLVCYVIIRDPHKELRNSFNYLLFNVSLADLLLGSICEPIAIGNYIREALVIREATNFIWVSHITFYITSMASLLSIIALTVERYLAISSDFVRKVDPKRAIYISVCIWLISFCISALYFAMGAFVFAFVYLNVLTLATLAIGCFTSFKISNKLRDSARTLASHGSNSAGNATLKREQNVTQGFILILTIFIIFNFPSVICAYVIAFCDVCSCDVIHWSRDFLFRFVMFNCAINQFIYVWRIPSFLKAIKTLLGKHIHLPKQNRVQPSTVEGVI